MANSVSSSSRERCVLAGTPTHAASAQVLLTPSIRKYIHTCLRRQQAGGARDGSSPPFCVAPKGARSTADATTLPIPPARETDRRVGIIV